MATYIVRWSRPTPIPGYEPSWEMYRGGSWEQAYDWARALPPTVAGGREYALRAGLVELYTALRDMDGSGEARLEVWSHQTGIVLGRPFTPERLGTVTVTAEGAA